jgi:hypothetical protein
LRDENVAVPAEFVVLKAAPRTVREQIIMKILMNSPKFLRFTAPVLVLSLLTACTHLGPRTVAMDRVDYSSTIADSWKQQTLFNIVKLRYMDLPVFVDVASIVAGYSMETKRALSTIVFLFTLAETGGADKLPMITIPAQ